MRSTIKVKCVFIQEFYELMGRFELEVELPEGSRLIDLIDYIDRRVKPGFRRMVVEDDNIRWPVEIAINGRRAEFLGGLRAPLKDGDRVLFSPRALFVV